MLVAVVLVQQELARIRDGFETDARIVHRLLSQRVVQLDAVLATLALLQGPPGVSTPEQRLSSVYPHILQVQRRDPGSDWSDRRMRSAESASVASGSAALAWVDFSHGRYQLVLAASPASFGLLMDLQAIVPWAEWPMSVDTSPVRVHLEHGGQRFDLQRGKPRDGGWNFDFRKHLAASSQPFDVVANRHVGWGELPWARMVVASLAVASALAALLALSRQRARRQRAEELLRLGQVSRLNTLGELAAGMAHELNQPLTAVLANTQAAARLLAEEPPDLDTARSAMAHAVQQSRRAAEVVGRLRKSVERPDVARECAPVDLVEAVRTALYLLEPEMRSRGVVPQVDAPTDAVMALAEPVALGQIIHNLLMNALQTLDLVPVSQRNLRVSLRQTNRQAEMSVIDSGPGIAGDVLPRLFEPFFSTRQGGLGLGLSLCETLATRMSGRIRAGNHVPAGSVFTLTLPTAHD